MIKEPMCPYCGCEMIYPAMGCQYECPHCGSKGPDCNDSEETYAETVQRYEPPVKPLTLDQFKAIYSTRENHAWPFDACPPYLFLESAIEKNDFCWLSWGVAKTLFEEGYRAYSADNYGEKWRFWTRKPTDEERRATAWMSP